MGRADQIAAEFPPGVSMPSELRALCDYLDRSGYPLSGGNRLRPEGETLKGWFGDGSEAWKQLAGFGAGPDGSILALWMYAGQDSSNAPVVHLGSEGNSLVVLADSFREFLQLLAIGYGELGFDDLNAPPKEPGTAEGLRAWLASEYGIRPAPSAAELVRRAQSRHPDFGQWVQAAQDLRDGRAEPGAAGHGDKT